jgi:hypothetical protein
MEWDYCAFVKGRKRLKFTINKKLLTPISNTWSTFNFEGFQSGLVELHVLCVTCKEKLAGGTCDYAREVADTFHS